MEGRSADNKLILRVVLGALILVAVYCLAAIPAYRGQVDSFFTSIGLFDPTPSPRVEATPSPSVAPEAVSGATPPIPHRFQLIVFRADWHSLQLGYDWEEALPILMNLEEGEGLYVIGLTEIEHYDWDAQVITLTEHATQALAEALVRAEQGEEAEALMGMRERLGWGNSLEWALYGRAFMVKVDGEAPYGGIFLDAVSQMPIRYPVLRVAVVGERAVIAVLPIHIPFVMVDPVGATGPADELAIAEEAREDVQQLGDFLTDWILGFATSDTANDFRELVRDSRIRALLESAGKLSP